MEFGFFGSPKVASGNEARYVFQLNVGRASKSIWWMP